jgi:DNA-binding ferritin-like protein
MELLGYAAVNLNRDVISSSFPGAAGSAHVLAVTERVAPYATALRAGITHAADVEDAGTAAVYTDIARGVEKRLWGLEAYLQC